MEDKESMILFNEQSADKEMNALSHSLNRINELLATTKSQSRVQENFYHSLLEEVPNGVLAWNSEKEFCLLMVQPYVCWELSQSYSSANWKSNIRS